MTSRGDKAKMATPKLVEIGNGEASFFGLKIEPGIKYNLLMKTSVCIANVALDPSTLEKVEEKVDEECDSNEEDDDDLMELRMGLRMIMDGNDRTLHGIDEQDLQYRAGFPFPEGSEITVYVKGNATYYICGYKTSVDYSSD